MLAALPIADSIDPLTSHACAAPRRPRDPARSDEAAGLGQVNGNAVCAARRAQGRAHQRCPSTTFVGDDRHGGGAVTSAIKRPARPSAARQDRRLLPPVARPCGRLPWRDRNPGWHRDAATPVTPSSGRSVPNQPDIALGVDAALDLQRTHAVAQPPPSPSFDASASCIKPDHVRDRHRLAHRSTEQLVDGLADALAPGVVQRDVDRALRIDVADDAVGPCPTARPSLRVGSCADQSGCEHVVRSGCTVASVSPAGAEITAPVRQRRRLSIADEPSSVRRAPARNRQAPPGDPPI